MADFLNLRNINKSFVGVQALKGVDFSIGTGEIHCLVGENGSGKSTMIKIISGVEQPDSGEIELEGEVLDHVDSIASIKKGIEVIYQDLSLFPNLTVAENIAIGELTESGKQTVRWPEVHEIAREAMEKIGLELDREATLGSLPVARQQMVAICRALTSDLRLLILDEPTTALTKKEVDQLFSVVKDLQRKGIAVLFVSHKLNEVFEIAERVTVLRDGRSMGTFPASELDDDKLTELMTGHKVTHEHLDHEPEWGTVLLSVRNLTKARNFKDISFDLHEGEILGVTGLIGSGRTELAQALFGKNVADSGEIYVNGKRVDIRSVRQAVETGISYVPENRLTEGLILNQSVANNIVTAIIRRLLKKPLPLIDDEQREEVVKRWIKELSIRVADEDVAAQTLSGGNQQRVVIAKWLATEPRILILDGPTVGIDVAAKSAVHNIIRHMAERGVGIILISDEVSEVVQNSNRVILMRRGRIMDIVDPRQVGEDEIQKRIEKAESVAS
jgi:simple sugar transport system ATP-binding protein